MPCQTTLTNIQVTCRASTSLPQTFIVASHVFGAGLRGARVNDARAAWDKNGIEGFGPFFSSGAFVKTCSACWYRSLVGHWNLLRLGWPGYYRHAGARNHLSRCAVRGCCEYLALTARQKGGRSRSHDAMIRVYDDVGNVIDTHEHKGDFKERQ